MTCYYCHQPLTGDQHTVRWDDGELRLECPSCLRASIESQPPGITMEDIGEVPKAYFTALRKTPRILPQSAMKDLIKGRTQ